MAIFIKHELVKPNLFQKVLGLNPGKNCEIEIANMLADHETSITEISFDTIREIAAKHKVELTDKNKGFRLALVTDYLKHCLNDKHLDEAEITALKHLRGILLLNESDTKVLLQNEAERIYQESLSNIVEHGSMNEQEKQHLESIKTNLLLPEEIATNIYEKTTTEYLQKFLDGIIADERLSPDEEKELNEIAGRLGAVPTFDNKTTEVLDLFRLLWRVENADIPVLESDINLKVGEKLHFKTYVKCREYRRVPKRINYAGPTARIKIVKGVYYRFGSIDYQNVSSDEMKIIDQGFAYLTNKRLIFMGQTGNKTIPISKILDFKPYTNGVDIQKDTGKSPFLEFEKNTILFTGILSRLLMEK